MTTEKVVQITYAAKVFESYKKTGKENGTRRLGWAKTVIEEGTVRLNENI